MDPNTPQLDLKKLKEIHNAVYEVRAKWRRIGLQLNLSCGTLDAIESLSIEDRLEKVLSAWLRAGSASWKNLVIALWSISVGETALAKELGQNHCPQVIKELEATDETRHDRQQQLDIKEIETDFEKLSQATRKSLKQKRIRPQNLAYFLTYKQTGTDNKGKSLVIIYSEHLRNARTIDEIFSILSLVCSYRDYELLENIIRAYGDENDEQRLECYIENIPPILKPANAHIINDSYQHISADFVVKLNFKVVPDAVPYQDFKPSIAKIFNIQSQNFCLGSVGEGCIEMLFIFPRRALQLPLTHDQKKQVAELTHTIEKITMLEGNEEEIIYSLKTEQSNTDMSDHILNEMPAFGRPLQLGALYDATRDEFIQANKLLEEKLLKAQQDKPYVDTQPQSSLILEHSLAKKFHYLGANNPTLKINLLAGMTNVSGAANFFKDKKRSTEVFRVAVHFKCSSHTQEIDIQQLISQIQSQENMGSTRTSHIVFKILFGSEVFVVLDRPYSIKENLTAIQNKLTHCADFLANMVHESGKSELLEIDQEEVEKYIIRIHSNCQIAKPPSTFNELVTILEHLLKQFKQERTDYLTPTKVWLYPLSKVDSSAPCIAQEVSEAVVTRVENIVEGLSHAKVHLSDISEKNMQVCSTIPCFQIQQSYLAELINRFAIDFKNQINAKVTGIRSGSVDNNELCSLLKQVENSPFSSDSIKFILTNIESEIKVVCHFLECLHSESVKHVSSDKIDELAFDFDQIVVFEFRLGGTNNALLSEMEEYLQTQAPSKHQKAASSKLKPWYKDVSKKRALQINAKLFKDFAQTNLTRSDTTFVIHISSDTPSPSEEGAAVVLHKNEYPIEFELPSKPLKVYIKKDTGEKVHLAWSTPERGRANVISYVVSYNDITDEHKCHNTEGLTELVIIPDLIPEHMYKFTVQAECTVGLGPKSEVVVRKPIRKRPLEEPTFPLSKQPKTIKEESELAKLPVTGTNANPILVSTVVGKHHKKNNRKKKADLLQPISTIHTSSLPVMMEESVSQSTSPNFSRGIQIQSGLESIQATEYHIHSSTGQAKDYPPSSLDGSCEKIFKMPQQKNVTHKSIGLEWEKPLTGSATVNYYTVSYHTEGDSHHIATKKTEGAEQYITIDGLSSNTGYVFRVQANVTSMMNLESEPTGVIQTKPHLAETIRLDSQFSKHIKKTSRPEKYLLKKNQVMIHRLKRIAKYEVGEPKMGTIKVLMLVGATGAGKTTLINGIVNYMYGVQWDDDFRFVLIDEPKGKSQAHSQTDWITVYTLYREDGSPIPYSLTIIDTPGFGDTKGVERDRQIADQIKDFFSIPPPGGIDVLHGIGFVAQASLARLCDAQKYVFDKVLSMYAKDMAPNIFLMTTFADSQTPQVIAAITEANVPYQKYFKFNNSALFVTGKEESFDAMFWKMGVKSFDDFFSHFGRTQHRSLQLTREVLEEREQLENLIKELQPQIHAGLSKMNQLQNVIAELEHNKALIEQNKDFSFTVCITKQRKVDTPPGRYTTNCLNCNYTCHDNCIYSKNEDKKKCCAMNDTTGNCKVCPGKCVWSKHVNNPYIFELYQEKEVQTSFELKERYDTAKKGESKAETMIANIKADLEALEVRGLERVDQARKSLVRLDEIALKRNPLTEVEYIDKLIISEETQGKIGWQARVKSLKTLKERALIIRKVKGSNKDQPPGKKRKKRGPKGGNDGAQESCIPTTSKDILNPTKRKKRNEFWELL